MNKSGGPTPVGSPRGINTGRTLPDVPTGGSNSVVTQASEVRTDESHGLPALHADSPNLAYERQEAGDQWDEDEFKPLEITSITLQQMELPAYEHAYVFDPQAAGITGSGTTAIQSPSRPKEDEQVDLSDFVSGLTKEDLLPATPSPQGEDTRMRRHNTRQSDVRTRFGASRSHAKDLNLKKLQLGSEVTPAAHTSPRQTYMPVSPRDPSLPRSSAQMFGQERKRPMTQVVPTGHVRSDSRIDQPRSGQGTVPPSKTSATKSHEIVAAKGLPSTSTPSKSMRRDLTKQGAASFAAIREEKAQQAERQKSAYQASLQNLEAELKELDHVYGELLSMTSSTEDVSTEPRQDKSENS